MHAFTYHSPTEIVFGKDTQLQLAEQIRKYGGNRVLLVYGSGSIERSGLLNQLCQVLTEAQIPYELFGGAKANPTLEHAREGVKLALKSNADFVIGAGAGCQWCFSCRAGRRCSESPFVEGLGRN